MFILANIYQAVFYGLESIKLNETNCILLLLLLQKLYEEDEAFELLTWLINKIHPLVT